MKKKIQVTLTAVLITLSISSIAQTVAWTQPYESRVITYTNPTWPYQYQDRYYPKYQACADYNYSGYLFVAGLNANGEITVNKIQTTAGSVVATHVETNSFASANPGYVWSLKVFRAASLTNYVYVFGREYNGSDYDAVLMQYDANLNLLFKKIINGPGGSASPDQPLGLEVDPLKGNPLILYNSGGTKLTRCNLNLSDYWTRALTSGYIQYRIHPGSNWIALVSAAGLQRISPDNYTTWTVASVTSAHNMSIDNGGNIFIANGGSAATLKKYSSSGTFIFNVSLGPLSNYVYCKADNTGGVFFSEEANHTLRKYDTSGSLLFNNTLPLSTFMVLNAMEVTNNNVFITGSKYDVISSPSPVHYVDTGFVYKYNSAGAFVYRDAFTVPVSIPISAYTGTYATGIAKYGTEITIVGKMFTHGIGYNTPYFSWFLRRYAPVARMAGFDSEQSESKIEIFPNPASANLHISSESEINKISIYDLTGSVVKEYNQEMFFETDLDVSFLKPGVYMLLATLRERQFTMKFVKQ